MAKVHGIYNRIHTLCHRQLVTVQADQLTEKWEDMTCVPCKTDKYNQIRAGYRPRWAKREGARST